MAEGDRTEAPTPKRLQKARDEGDVLRSREFASALVILIGCGWMVFFGPALLAACRQVMAASFAFGRADVEHFEPFRPLAEAGWKLAPSLGALFAVAIAAAVLSQAGLGALTFNAKNLGFKANKLNPASGLKRIFGMQGWIELAKSLLKVVLLGAIGVWMLWHTAQGSMGLVSSDLNRAVGALGSTFLTLLFAMAGGLVAIAAIDVPVTAFRRLQNLRMTKQEVKDEHKDTEGDPKIKAKIRQIRMERTRRRMMQAIPKATVIIANPTHYAVALRYVETEMKAPVCVAKGVDELALRIRFAAKEHKVAIVENPPLARSLYATVDVDEMIPQDHYKAVAEVISFVLRLKTRGRPPIQRARPTPARPRIN